MSLKLPPREDRTGELLDAIEAFISGEKNSEDKLYMLFEEGVITSSEYMSIIKKHRVVHLINKEKTERKNARKIKHMLCSIAACAILFASILCTLAYVVSNYDKSAGVWYLLLSLWAFYYTYIRDN